VYVRAVMLLTCGTGGSPRSVVPQSGEWPGKDTRSLRQTVIGSKRTAEDARCSASDVDWPGKPLKTMRQTTLVFHTRTADASKK
jgi:hypothetical protein